jgi:dolichyl-diphosphooligosaccharide--protein glycosyltransferase
MSEEAAAAELLTDRPDLADAVEAILAVDEESETWTFEDVPIESGPFGELVNSGVVERIGEEYRVANPDVVRAVVQGEENAEFNLDTGSKSPSIRSRLRLSIDRTTGAVIAIALAFVVSVRSHPILSVYREDNVVLSGNDPYYYRYWVEEILLESDSVFDLGALSTLPEAVRNGEPLMVASLWWVSELIGNGTVAAGHVLAWYPVVSALICAVLIYTLTLWMTGDQRVALAAVLMLALIPGHALRTSVGFADHHAFDYVWLAATGAFLVKLSQYELKNISQSRTWLAAAALGVAITGQVLAWDAGPLLILPVGIFVLLGCIQAIYLGKLPSRSLTPLLPGLTVAAVLTGGVHTLVGWHSPITAITPTLLLAGAIASILLGEIIARTTESVRQLAAIYLGGGIAAFAVLGYGNYGFWTTLLNRLGVLFEDRGIAETLGLFSTDSFGFIFLLGFTLLLALPAMVHGIRRAVDSSEWLAMTAYAWFFLLLATIQVRFVGELAIFLSVFAGLGIVWVAAWIDAIPPLSSPAKQLRLPDRNTLFTLSVLFLLVSSLGAVQVGVKTSQITTSQTDYETADFISEHAAELGEEYPNNYVLSRWSKNRLYNYFVNGESESYGYARSTYPDVISSTDPDSRYDSMNQRVGYIVISTGLTPNNPNIAYTKLAKAFGSRTAEAQGVGHYRAIYLSPKQSYVVHELVPGAVLAGAAPPNATVSVSRAVEIPNGQFTYERQTVAMANGTYAIRLAHPGTYTVDKGNTTQSVTVPESAVRNGQRVAA